MDERDRCQFLLSVICIVTGTQNHNHDQPFAWITKLFRLVFMLGPRIVWLFSVLTLCQFRFVVVCLFTCVCMVNICNKRRRPKVSVLQEASQSSRTSFPAVPTVYLKCACDKVPYLVYVMVDFNPHCGTETVLVLLWQPTLITHAMNRPTRLDNHLPTICSAHAGGPSVDGIAWWWPRCILICNFYSQSEDPLLPVFCSLDKQVTKSNGPVLVHKRIHTHKPRKKNTWTNKHANSFRWSTLVLLYPFARWVLTSWFIL